MDKYIKTDNGHFSLNLLNNLGGGNVIITALNQAFDKTVVNNSRFQQSEMTFRFQQVRSLLNLYQNENSLC